MTSQDIPCHTLLGLSGSLKPQRKSTCVPQSCVLCVSETGTTVTALLSWLAAWAGPCPLGPQLQPLLFVSVAYKSWKLGWVSCHRGTFSAAYNLFCSGQGRKILYKAANVFNNDSLFSRIWLTAILILLLSFSSHFCLPCRFLFSTIDLNKRWPYLRHGVREPWNSLNQSSYCGPHKKPQDTGRMQLYSC